MISINTKHHECVLCKEGQEWTIKGNATTATTATEVGDRDAPELATVKVEHDSLGIDQSEIYAKIHVCESRLVAVGHIWDLTDEPEAAKARQARQYMFDFQCETPLSESRLSFVYSLDPSMAPGRLPLHPNVCPVAFHGKHALPPWAEHLLPGPDAMHSDTAPERIDPASSDHHHHHLLDAPSQAHALVLGPFDATLHSRVLDLQGAADGIPDDVLEVFVRDIAGGIMHLVRHAGVQGPLTMQDIVWDSGAGPDGIGRAMVVPSQEQLSSGWSMHDVESLSGGASSSCSGTNDSGALETDSDDDLPAAASGAGSSDGSRTSSPRSTRSVHGADSADEGASDDGKYDTATSIADTGTLDGESSSSERTDTSSEYGDAVKNELDAESAEQAAAWHLGVILHQLATGGKHPFWYMPERKWDHASDRRDRIMHWHERLKPRPVWLQRAIEGLMCSHA